MKLINTEGLVVFGPGSEWLWVMLQFLALATTFYAIYRQLRLQAGQRAIDQVQDFRREYDSERMVRYRIAVATALKGGNRPPGYAASAILDYWEGLGGLVRRGHLDPKVYWDSVGVECQADGIDLRPYVQANRDQGNPAIGEHFEWLAAKITSLDRRSGSSVVYDEAWSAKTRGYLITNLENRLRVEEELRAVVTMSPNVSAPVPPIDQATAPSGEG